MNLSRSTFSALLFFGFSFLCVLNPEPLPARDWFNGVLEVMIGWAR
jgi:hypothetical protein